MKKAFKLIGGFLAVLLVLILVGPLLLPTLDTSDLAAPRDFADADSQFVTIPFDGMDGLELHYKEAGGGTPTFILLHGFSADVQSWAPVFDLFAERGRTLAYDRIPFGLSQRPLPDDWQAENPYTPDAAVTELIAFMDEMGVDQAILVGHSAGGNLAVRTTLAHPERVEALILEAPAIYTNGAPAFIGTIADTPQMKRLGPYVARQFSQMGQTLINQAYHDPSKVDMEAMMATAVTDKIRDWDTSFWEFTAATAKAGSPVPDVAQINVSTIVITGDDDRIVPTEESVGLSETIPNAELVVIPATGHIPHDESTDEFVTAVTDWLDSQSDSR